MRKNVMFSTLVLLLAGCATAPTGPRVAVMPAPGKPLEQFAEEDRICRQFAAQSVGQERNEAASENFARNAALGTAIGATAGALAGGRESAGGGAAAGLVVGSMAGAGQSSSAAYDAQRRYDIAYEQCMYTKGNQIPGYSAPRGAPYPPPPPR